ncbi:unnamed protein product [Onchocerca flexuosa]|uniref:phosphoribosylaminoimidazole carboxylase n=1 Tax=Onchocerca flexuosa TaxID=387005 RepID=A0A183H917_9BILA|nr:unnamed protein product [Onchocerca flexuosa]
MGSQSDYSIVVYAADMLKALGISHNVFIISAIGPERLFNFAKFAQKKGYKIIIAGAGEQLIYLVW